MISSQDEPSHGTKERHQHSGSNIKKKIQCSGESGISTEEFKAWLFGGIWDEGS